VGPRAGLDAAERRKICGPCRHAEVTTNRVELYWIWGCHGGDYEQFQLLGCDAVKSGRLLPPFRRNIFEEYGCFMLACYLAYSSIVEIPSKRRVTSDRLHRNDSTSDSRTIVFAELILQLNLSVKRPRVSKQATLSQRTGFPKLVGRGGCSRSLVSSATSSPQD
jgi:hypothetical protein